ncbi:DUF1993 family protein, partial [Bradyrhizobium uaiense]|nr:DUF1993 domain-containing protein [Bradyrhizobium uaiense]
MTISLHEASVGVYVPYLRNLSALLDHAEAHARARKIEPDVLLGMRLSPNMYSLRQQVGEANRHVVLSCALLAGSAPPVFGEPETEQAELNEPELEAVEPEVDEPEPSEPEPIQPPQPIEANGYSKS